MYIKRHMEQLLKQIATQYPVLLVTGPRRVGKTTMLEYTDVCVETQRSREVGIMKKEQ